MAFDTSMYQNFRGGTGLAALGQGVQSGLDIANAAKQNALQQQQAQRQQTEFETQQAARALDIQNKIGEQLGSWTGDFLKIQDPAQREQAYAAKVGELQAMGVPKQYLPSTSQAAMPFIQFQAGKYQRTKEAEALKLQRERAEIGKIQADARRSGGGDPIAQALAMERLDKFKRDQEEKELGLAVPGYRRTGEVLPKAEEAMKIRKATSDAEQLVTKLSRLKDLVKEDGSYEYGGTSGTEMESLATEIQLLAKGENMYQLGVLTGPDMRLLEKITSDPSSLGSLFTRDSTRQTQIDTQLKSIKEKLAAVTKASGYAKAGEQPPPETVEMIDPSGKTRMIPANMVGEAIAAGGRRAKTAVARGR